MDSFILFLLGVVEPTSAPVLVAAVKEPSVFDPLLAAMLPIFVGVATGVGGLLILLIRLAKVRIENQIAQEQSKEDREKDLALEKTLNNLSYVAVKAVAQTLTAGKRDEKGALPAPVAAQAQKAAIETVKDGLSPEQAAQAKAKYGPDGQLDAALVPRLEAALHDIKAITTSTSVETPTIDGKTTTTTTTATEPQPPK